jgi:plastocyanin
LYFLWFIAQGEVADIYAGLFGAILVVAENATCFDDETLLPTDGSDEMFLHFSVMNEGGSFHLDENIARVPQNRNLSEAEVTALKANADFEESNLMHAVNGYMYCAGALPLKELTVGRPTNVYFYSLGSDVDFHSVTVGNEALKLEEGQTKGSAKLLAGTFTSAVVTPVQSGSVELRCTIDDHVAAGMRMLLNVTGSDRNMTAGSGYTIKHYIAAEEVEWNYTPEGTNKCTGEGFGEDEKVFVQAGENTPGSRYVKARYTEFTDSSFKERKNSNPAFAGIVGPVLHLEVGDEVEVVFRNNLDFAVNLNIVGLARNCPCEDGDSVDPGAEVTYSWSVPESAGPGKNDLNSVAYVYYSSVDSFAHAHAGLIGAVSVTASGELDSKTRLPKDRDAVIPLLFNIFRENSSPLMRKSISKFALGDVSDDKLAELEKDDAWLESNAMHAANGYLYCNNPELEVAAGSTVRFIVFGLGSEVSMHAPFFDHQVIQRGSRRGAGVQIFPYSAEIVDVNIVTSGETVAGCVIVDHREAGMQVLLTARGTHPAPEDVEPFPVNATVLPDGGVSGRTAELVVGESVHVGNGHY